MGTGPGMRDVAAVQDAFNRLAADTPTDLSGLYADEVVFVDPAHRVEGRAALEAYFDRLNRNVRELRFVFDGTIGDGDEVALPWTMHLTLKRPRKSIVLPGMTHLRFDQAGLVVWHRDHFDLGAMVYEQVPVLGWMVKAIRRAL